MAPEPLRRELPPIEQTGLWQVFGEGVLHSYSQIFFSANRFVGAILLAATFVAPLNGVMGLLSVLIALLSARILHFSAESSRLGLLSYNALLVGLGIGALYDPTWTTFGLLVVGAFFSVLATATLNSALGSTFNLPSLTLPFLVVFYLLTAVALRLVGVEAADWSYNPFLLGEWLPHPIASYLKTLGAIFFLPRVDVGFMMLLGLVVYSRIAWVLSVLGFVVAYPLSLHLVSVPDATLHLMMGYNLILTAVALGGVWFVPRFPSFIFAFGGVLVAAILTVGGQTLLNRMGLSLLILPFNLTVIPMLYAMRQRVSDGSPKAVDFVMGTPEQNLNYFQTRMARFGYLYFVQFSAPFMGRWQCTQGNDGEHTHKAQWRHGFDFEVFDEDGSKAQGAGRRVEDYYCWRLPVLAPADGTVVEVVADIKDNKVGDMNLKDNFGNVVVIYHAVGLYSMVAHLARGSIKVKEGEVVKRGDIVGLCGNSGRSPEPHIHFQLQGTARVGAPTIEAAFHEAVKICKNGEVLQARAVPEKGETYRNLEPEEDFKRILSFDIGSKWGFEYRRGNHRHQDVIESEIDLFGNLKLVSQRDDGVVFFENKDTVFVIYDYQGPNRSVLSVINFALPRVPLEAGDGLRWNDHLVSRYFYAIPGRIVRDLVSPFLGLGGLRMRYSSKRTLSTLIVVGESEEQLADGSAVLETRAELSDREGLERASIRLNRTEITIARVAVDSIREEDNS